MKRALISEFKAHLSAYVAEVRSGESVIVCDRRTPVARLVPYEEAGLGIRIRHATASPEKTRQVRGVSPRESINIVAELRLDRDRR